MPDAQSLSPTDRPWRREIERAAARIAPYATPTPLRRSAALSDRYRADVWLKLECVQHTGSFKVRGAAAKLTACREQVRSHGFVVASSGNHGLACAAVAEALGLHGTIVLPENVAPAKLRAVQRFDVEVHQEGTDVGVTEAAGRRLAAERGRVYVPPYNDSDVVAGQGTIGRELDAADAMPFETILVPVGGGGLIAGIAAWYGATATEVIGCQPAASAVMAASVRAGRIVVADDRDTLADGTAGGLEPDTITLPICQRLVERFVLVSEASIADAIVALLEDEHLVVEGAGALGVAALAREPDRWCGRRVAVILSGSRIGIERLTEVLGARA